MCLEQKQTVMQILAVFRRFCIKAGKTCLEQKQTLARIAAVFRRFCIKAGKTCLEQRQTAVRILAVFRQFCINGGSVCFEHRQALLRLLMVFCLYEAIIFYFSPLFAGTVSVLAEKMHNSEAAAGAGVGGGAHPISAIMGEQLDEGWSLELGMLEPESFSKPQILLYNSYTIQPGDIIGELSANFGLNQDTLISINGIKNTRLIQIGQVLRIPNQDGILYTVKNSDTLETIAEKYNADIAAIQYANELLSGTALPNTVLFIPGAQLNWVERQEINGDLFIWPAAGSITSPYGWRKWPFGGDRQFHAGMDIGASAGTPVRAAMSGRVTAAGWDNVLGNYVVVSHHSGYRTMYGHLSAIKVQSGAYVGTGERIGDVGSTGVSTGAHLHFTVYKNGVTVNPRNLLK